MIENILIIGNILCAIALVVTLHKIEKENDRFMDELEGGIDEETNCS